MSRSWEKLTPTHVLKRKNKNTRKKKEKIIKVELIICGGAD
jgi:hypothetical protein